MNMLERICVLVLALLGAAAGCHAQGYPAKPVRIIVSYGAGGGVDLMARMVAAKLQERMGQPFVVENRAGAAGTIGAAAVAKAAPDGYTILAGGNPEVTILPHMLSNLPYDPQRDLAPITLAANVPSVLVVHPSLDVKSVRELLELAHAKPVPYGTPGRGTPMHLAMEMINASEKTQFVHVPYKGGGPATNDVVGGQVGMAIINAPPLLPHIRAGRIKALAIMQAERSPLLPDVPTFKEASGMDNVLATAWFAFFAPAKTPHDILQRLEAEIRATLEEPATKARLVQGGMDIWALPSERFAQQIRAESAYYEKAIKQFGVKPD
jgi:tripartite-type tricarboxylate transporter receptor subunit TctC